MTFRFSHIISADGLHIRLTEQKLLRAARGVPFDAWQDHLGKPAMRSLRGLIESGDVRLDGDELTVPHSVVAALSAAVADPLGLPSIGAFSLSLQFEERIETPDGRIKMRWSDANYKTAGVERQGAILRIGKEVGRLSETFYRLSEAIDRFNATAGGEIDSRIAAWAPIQQELATATGQRITADAFMKSLTFYQAGAFALDVAETTNGPDFTPILMGRAKVASLEDDAPAADIDGAEVEAGGRTDMLDAGTDALLPPELQRRFVEKNFNVAARAHDAYVLGRNTYVVLDPGLKTALDVVRAKRKAPPEERRAFLRNPRPVIAEALAVAGQDTTSLFIETTQYSDRVEGLGVWADIKTAPSKGSTGWLPEKFDGGAPAPQVVNAQNIEEIAGAVERARAAGEDAIVLDGSRVPIVDIEPQIAKVRQEINGGAANPPHAEPDPKTEEADAKERIGLTIKNNIDGVEYTIPVNPRPRRIAPDFPYALMSANAPKEHQTKGFDWLVEAWTKGWPGVLLADDMGLGKTYQALAFLAWIRANMRTGGRGHPTAAAFGPLLVVAPTALLRNWLAESRLHLAQDGLGEAVEAFGSGLKRLKRPKGTDWTPENALDLEQLRKADWILTTYETLADNHRAFARLPYSVVVFDEIQKIKEPGSINARSSKTINADFVLGLTGTPIENKLEDLWAIFDRIAPGYLGALRDFSKRYADHNPKRLKELKASLDERSNGLPAPMLRRMKDKARDGLPEKRVETYKVTMPKPQAEAYRQIVAQARGAGGSRRQMLEILHRMRGISLHPARAEVDTSDPSAIDAWLNGSARTCKAVEILQSIDTLGEKALVFIEDLAVQRAFAESMGMIFDLPKTPVIINGGVAGGARQDIVDRFQKSPPGFDLLILSPKAAGVGLTITAANHVLHLSRWWNPAVEDQCNDRAYRIGATRDVIVHIPLAIHPDYGDQSFDVKLHALLERKRSLSRDMLCPPESEGDVDELFGGVAVDQA
jgi:hypothetical protein